jgi:hypothetical protein
LGCTHRGGILPQSMVFAKSRNGSEDNGLTRMGNYLDSYLGRLAY